jgi:hypothetical protein
VLVTNKKLTKETLLDELEDQIIKDIEQFGDWTVLDELLRKLPTEDLIHALPEDKLEIYLKLHKKGKLPDV